MSELPLLLAAVLAGLLAVPHCLAMCGGLSAGLCALAGPRPGVEALYAALALNLGRVAGYGLLGAVSGSGGGLLYADIALASAALTTRWLSAAALLLIALAIAFPRLRLPLPFAAKAARPLAWAMGRARRLPAFLLGAAWSLLPCGLSFAALLAAFASGSAGAGFLIMAGFGLGTLVATLPAALGLRLALADRRGRSRLALLLAVAGLIQLALPWWAPPHAAESALLQPMCKATPR